MMGTSGDRKKCPLFSQANNLYKNKKIHPPFNDTMTFANCAPGCTHASVYICICKLVFTISFVSECRLTEKSD